MVDAKEIAEILAKAKGSKKRKATDNASSRRPAPSDSASSFPIVKKEQSNEAVIDGDSAVHAARQCCEAEEAKVRENEETLAKIQESNRLAERQIAFFQSPEFKLFKQFKEGFGGLRDEFAELVGCLSGWDLPSEEEEVSDTQNAG